MTYIAPSLTVSLTFHDKYSENNVLKKALNVSILIRCSDKKK